MKKYKKILIDLCFVVMFGAVIASIVVGFSMIHSESNKPNYLGAAMVSTK